VSFIAPLWWAAWPITVGFILWFHTRRSREVVVGSLYLWRQVAGAKPTRSSAARPKPSWALWLQLLTATLLIVALAGPRGSAPHLDHLVVVIDASAAMAATDVEGGRWRAAETALQLDLQRLDARVPVSVLHVGADAAWQVWRTDGRTAMKHLDIPIDATNRPAWWAAAQLLPHAVRADSTVGIMVLTTPEGIAAAQDALAGVHVPATLAFDWRVYGDATRNAGLRDVTLTPAPDGWTLRGVLDIFGPISPGDVPVTIAFESLSSPGVLPWDTLAVPVRRAGSWPFQTRLTLPSAGIVRLSLAADTFPLDDRAFAAAVEQATTRVLHVGPENPPLARALAAVADVQVFRALMLPQNAEAFDLVILDRVTLAESPRTSTLWLGGASTKQDSLPLVEILNARTFDTAHPLSSGVAWREIEITEAYPIPPIEGGEVIFAAGSQPLVQARTTASGREVQLAFNPLDTPWPTQPSFPAFIANVVDWARFPNEVAVCAQAAPCRLPRAALAGGWRLQSSDGQIVAASPPLPSATGEPAIWWPGMFDGVTAPTTPDVYELTSAATFARVVVGASHVVAPVGSYPIESDLPALTGLPLRPSQFWWWLALAVLLVELVLAGVGRERFFTRANLRGPKALMWRSVRIGSIAAAAAALVVLAGFDVRAWLPTRVPAPLLVIGSASDDASATAQGVATVGSRALLSDGSETLNLEAGLREAILRARQTGVQSIGIQSDGQERVGDAWRFLLSYAAESDLSWTILPAPSAPVDPAPRLTLDAPARVRAGDVVTLRLHVDSPFTANALLRWTADDTLVHEEAVSINVGETTFALEVVADEVGSRAFRAALSVDSDAPVPVGVLVDVEATPSVLVVSPQLMAAESFVRLLEVQGVNARTSIPVNMPWSLAQWEGVDVVVLMNVPALELHSEQQAVLQRWVREDGGGVLILGGENSFGPGGYYQTTLEAISPLSSEVPRDAPEVAMLFVLDRSGSMQQSVGGVSRLEIAKLATLAALDLLAEQSFVGIVAFDERAETIVPMVSVSQRDELEAALARLRANGGTSIYPALVAAREVLQGVDSATKHVVVFTDGLSQPGDFEGALLALGQDQVSVSTVGIGQGTDANQLSAIARAGGGTFHQTNDFRALPGILAQEALLLSGSPVQEGTVSPRWSDDASPFASLAGTPIPPLDGFVLTTMKPEANLHLSTAEGDPLLASWTYGLGRVAAFTSQGLGPWALRWLEWPSAPSFWNDLLGWASPRALGAGMYVSTSLRKDEVVVRAEVIGADGSPVRGLSPSFTWLEAQSGTAVPMREGLPGLYQATAPLPGRGDWTLRVDDGQGLTFDQLLLAASPLPVDARADAFRLAALQAGLGAATSTFDAWVVQPWPWRIGQVDASRWTWLALLVWLSGLWVRYNPTLGLLRARIAQRYFGGHSRPRAMGTDKHPSKP